MGLYECIVGRRVRSLAVTGMAKNCGKTTVLDTLILEAAAHGVSIGITSAGRDGEKIDAVTGLPKPSIWAPAGSLVVTALGTLVRSEAHLEVLAQTGYETPAGSIALGRVTAAGAIEIIGGNRHEQAARAIEMMQSHGAELVLVDGAANRVFLAAPTLVDGVVLATGAAVDPSMENVLAQTRFALEIWNLPPVESGGLREEAGLLTRGATVIDKDWRARVLDLPTVLSHEAEVAALVDDATRAVVIHGALTDELLDSVMNARRRRVDGLKIVAADPTRVLAGMRAYHRFKRRGGAIQVLKPVRILAVTLNPTSPYWPAFDADEFLERSLDALSPLPVYDVVLGRGSG